MTFASRLLHASSLFTDSFATPSAMMRKILGRLELSGPRTIGLLLWREENSQREGKNEAFESICLKPGDVQRFVEGVEAALPFNEVTQEVKRVDGLLFVLVER